MRTIIVAASENGVIGKNGKIPWYCQEDLAHFRKVTMGHTIVMGRKTYDSIRRPLDGRKNIVLTSDTTARYPSGVTLIHSFDEVPDDCFIIGGQTLFEHFLPIADKIILSVIDGEYEGDTFFPIDAITRKHGYKMSSAVRKGNIDILEYTK